MHKRGIHIWLCARIWNANPALWSPRRTEALIKTGKVPDVSIRAAQKNYKKALEKGLLKIMSKVRICRPLQSVYL